MGETAAAAMAIFVVIERMCYVVYIGLGHSACILVGNKVGECDEKSAYEYGKKFLWTGVVSALVIGSLIYLLRGHIVSAYHISSASQEALNWTLLSFALISWTSVFNYVNIVGVLRGGGDTRTAAIIDLVGMYLFTLPVAYILGLIVKLPVHIVYFCMIAAGDTVKMAAGIRRFRSKKWIRNLVDQNERFEVQL
jgi:Na+-driven multidrug efflux pump